MGRAEALTLALTVLGRYLVGAVEMKRGTLIRLTERGAEAAGELEKKAVELGLT
jgi:hypothetical protein